MDQQLLHSYLATLYEIPTSNGVLRITMDGETLRDKSTLPELLQGAFAILTAYNPRSMLLPRRVNELRHQVMRDLLVLGCYRLDPCVGYELDKKDSVWREQAWVVFGMDRNEAIAFGRVFRQNTVIYSTEGRPEIIVTDPTADDLGRSFESNWRVRT